MFSLPLNTHVHYIQTCVCTRMRAHTPPPCVHKHTHTVVHFALPIPPVENAVLVMLLCTDSLP